MEFCSEGRSTTLASHASGQKEGKTSRCKAYPSSKRWKNRRGMRSRPSDLLYQWFGRSSHTPLNHDCSSKRVWVHARIAVRRRWMVTPSATPAAASLANSSIMEERIHLQKDRHNNVNAYRMTSTPRRRGVVQTDRGRNKNILKGRKNRFRSLIML